MKTAASTIRPLTVMKCNSFGRGMTPSMKSSGNGGSGAASRSLTARSSTSIGSSSVPVDHSYSQSLCGNGTATLASNSTPLNPVRKRGRPRTKHLKTNLTQSNPAPCVNNNTAIICSPDTPIEPQTQKPQVIATKSPAPDLKPTLNVTTRRPRIKSNPFRLTTCQEFPDHESPFTIALSVESLCLIDTHAHLDEHEVIGLLGGNFHQNTRELCIDMAVPCRAEKSSNRDCEMDAASQLEGAEKIFKSNRKVVGWYHSHPTFQDNPSGRDIETQTDFQRHWCKSSTVSSCPSSDSSMISSAHAAAPFALSPLKMYPPYDDVHSSRSESSTKKRLNKKTTRLSKPYERSDTKLNGDHSHHDSLDDHSAPVSLVVPFVGMILSPYFPLYSKSAREPMRSQFKCLIVQEGIPYQIKTRIVRRDRIHLQLPLYVGQMCRWIRQSRTKQKLEEKIATNLTIAQKLTESISSFLLSAGLSRKEISQLTENIQIMLYDNYRIG